MTDDISGGYGTLEGASKNPWLKFLKTHKRNENEPYREFLQRMSGEYRKPSNGYYKVGDVKYTNGTDAKHIYTANQIIKIVNDEAKKIKEVKKELIVAKKALADKNKAGLWEDDDVYNERSYLEKLQKILIEAELKYKAFYPFYENVMKNVKPITIDTQHTTEKAELNKVNEDMDSFFRKHADISLEKFNLMSENRRYKLLNSLQESEKTEYRHIENKKRQLEAKIKSPIYVDKTKRTTDSPSIVPVKIKPEIKNDIMKESNRPNEHQKEINELRNEREKYISEKLNITPQSFNAMTPRERGIILLRKLTKDEISEFLKINDEYTKRLKDDTKPDITQRE